MPSADQLKAESRIMAIFVGESGTGKSCAAAFLPKKILWLALTKRVYGIMGHPLINKSPMLKDIDVEFYPVDKGFKALDDRLELLVNKGPNIGYKTVVLEDLTTASDLLISDAFQWTGMLKNADGKGISWHKHLGPVDLPGLDEYGYEDQAFKDISLALNCLPCNVICMVHWTDKYEENKVVGKKISLRNATIPKVVKWFNEIWYFDKKMKATMVKVDDKTQTVSKPTYTCTFTNDLARTCFPQLPVSIEWTGKNFWEMVNDYLKIGEEIK